MTGLVSPERNSITIGDDRAVVLLRDVADAQRQAAVDVVVEARDRVAARLRPLARPVGKTRFSTSRVSRTFFADA